VSWRRIDQRAGHLLAGFSLQAVRADFIFQADAPRLAHKPWQFAPFLGAPGTPEGNPHDFARTGMLSAHLRVHYADHRP